MSAAEPYEAICRYLATFNADEIEALTWFAKKLSDGRAKHGPLDLANDARDFRCGKEIREELIDAAFYAVFDAIKEGRRDPR